MAELPDGMSLEDGLKMMTQLVRDMRTHREFYVAAVTCMLYDILITIELERSLIWKARWSYGKLLYFLVRYFVAFEVILWLVYTVYLEAPEPFCRFEAYLGIWASWIDMVLVQIIIVLRIIVIWDKNRIVAALLWFSFFAADIAILVTISRLMTVFEYRMVDALRPILGCASGIEGLDPMSTVPGYVVLIWFDTVLFVLTLVRGISQYRALRTPLLTVLFRDGFAYYCVMLAFVVVSTVFLIVFPETRPGISAMFIAAMRASYSIIGSRLILNLRSAASPYVDFGSRMDHIDLRISTFSAPDWKMERNEERMFDTFEEHQEAIQLEDRNWRERDGERVEPGRRQMIPA